MTFPVQTIANAKIQFNKITLFDVLELARIESTYHEKQLSQILTTALSKDSEDVAILTVQERYAYFLRYLHTVDYNSIDESITSTDYMSADFEDFDRERKYGVNGVSVRHLRGVDVEALEIGCSETIDWILGAMAITIGTTKYKDLPPLDGDFTLNYTGKIIANRIEVLKKLSDIEFDELAKEYMNLCSSMQTLVKFSFNNGVVLEKFEGGADDAPVRFRPTNILFGEGKQIYNIAVSERKQSQEEQLL